MHASLRIVFTAGLAGSLLGGCALGQRLGWTTRHDVDATEAVRVSCEEATRTLANGPDHGTAQRACLDAKTRQHVTR